MKNKKLFTSAMEDPLLQAGSLYRDCPGCKCLQLKKQGARPPIKLLLFLSSVILANVVPISVLYPFIYFMVADFHVAKTEEDIGYYAGWIGSSFMAGRVLTGILWGMVADKYGRKVVMYSGLISVLVFNTLFGLSTNLWTAIISRFLLGVFNGMLGTVKAYASEICSEEHQAIAMSLVGTIWGFGLIIGPAIGGWLSQPAKNYPEVFTEGSLFARYPYLLQALCISSFALLALVACFFLPETLHMHPRSEAKNQKESKVENKESLVRNWPFMASTLLYCIWSMYDITYTEIYSLWAVSPKSSGGLGFTSTDVGEVLAVSGFVMLIVQLAVCPVIVKLLGSIVTTRVFAILTIPLLVAFPFVAKLQGFRLLSAVYITSILRFIFAEAVMTGAFMLINNSVKQHQRGAANGLSLSLISLFKAIGPASGGSIFAWCQTRQNSVILPGDQLVFFFLNVMVLLTSLSTFEPFLPGTTNKPIQEEFNIEH